MVYLGCTIKILCEVWMVKNHDWMSKVEIEDNTWEEFSSKEENFYTVSPVTLNFGSKI